jgi:predicted nicotinamide N-methyase
VSLAPRYFDFIQQNTELSTARLSPEIKLHLASSVTPLWQATESWLGAENIPPPYWAFAWPGSEALASTITDQPQLVAGQRVLDFAAGCGLAALACARAGARWVEASDIDPFAGAAMTLNARDNFLIINIFVGDLVGVDCRWDVILCGDICYAEPMTSYILPWLRECARTALVLIADPGRKYVPVEGREVLARMTVPVSRDLEDRAEREVTLFRLLPASGLGEVG